MNENKSVFETLFEINVNDHIEKKKDLTYLSWPYAWAEIKKKYPNATYKIHLFGEKQLPTFSTKAPDIWCLQVLRLKT